MASIVVVGPHPDDQELGMGGAIARLARQGHTVRLIDVTNGEPTPHGTPELRAEESAAAAQVLGVGRTLLGLKNREVTHNVESRHALAALYRVYRPNVIFVPYPIDAHPDHVAVTRIAEDARFDAKLTRTSIPGEPWYPKRIIYYYCTHLRMNFNPTFCIDISTEIEQKMAALACYASQFGHGAAVEVPAMIRTIAGYFGNRIGTQYAEPFFTQEMLGLGGLDELV